MSNRHTVSWYDEVEAENTFSPPLVEYDNTPAGYMAGLLAQSGNTPIGDVENVDYDYDDDVQVEEPPAYLPVPPNYEQEVYDDEAADVSIPVLDALYGLTISRIDDNSAGAQEGTRLHRGRSVPTRAIEPVTAGATWWKRETYIGMSDVCLGSAPLHSGVPYGPGVRAANWSDTHLKVKDVAEQNRYYLALRVGPGAHGHAYVETPGGVVDCIWSPIELEGVPCTEYYFKQGPEECSVFVYWKFEEYRDVLDVAISCDLWEMRQRNTYLADRMSLVLSAYSTAVLEEEVTPTNVLQLNNSGLKEMKHSVKRTQHGASLSKVGPTVAHALSTVHEDLTGGPGEQHVDFSMWQEGRGVYHGRLRASDVPPSQIVLLGANGGLSISGSLVVVRALCTHSVSLVCTSATANYAFRPAISARKHAPCVRDGLMSPIACAALHGDAQGVLTVTVGTEVQRTETILTDAIQRGGFGKVRTLDINGTRAALADIGALCGYTTAEWLGARIYWVVFRGHGREVKIGLQYRGDAPTRWEALLSAESRRGVAAKLHRQTDSEIGLDWGASGLGRYLLVPYTRFGLLNAKKIMVARKGPFSALTYDDQGKRRIIAPSADVMNYVIDTEFINIKRDGVLMTYVYAVGIAKFSNGAYMGSWAAMDLEENTDALLGTLSSSERRGYADAITKLRCDGVPNCDMVEVLLAIRKRLLANPNVRIYAKGREAEQRLMTSSVAGGTRLFRAQAAAAGDVIRELGPLLPRYEEAAARVGWPAIHNPAREAVLFGHLAGLCHELPTVSMVGIDGLNTIMPAYGGIQI